MAQDNHVALVNALSKWIEEHLGRVIHLEELAAYSGYSLWHMQKIFKEVTGISLGKYIRQRRLAGAVNLLRNSSQSIFDIALDLVPNLTLPTCSAKSMALLRLIFGRMTKFNWTSKSRCILRRMTSEFVLRALTALSFNAIKHEHSHPIY